MFKSNKEKKLEERVKLLEMIVHDLAKEIHDLKNKDKKTKYFG